jgi:3-methyladenine DNA glycosylase AlkD
MQVIDELRGKFEQHASKEKGMQMKAYTRHQFSFFGIQSTERRVLQNEWLKEWKNEIEAASLEDLLRSLFQQEEREFQYAAVDYLKRIQKDKLTPSILPLLEELITTKSWWDTVDLLATHNIGHILKKNQPLQEKYVAKWIASNNLWLQRTAILYQLKYKGDTNLPFLKTILIALKDNTDFFIQKAIGWILRENAKTNLFWVKQCIEELELKGLSKREALKNQPK